MLSVNLGNYQQNINSSPAYFEAKGEISQPTGLVIPTFGLNVISIVIQASGESFNGQSYTISVSRNGLEWTELLNLNLGFEFNVTNSFSYADMMALVLNFPFIKVSVPARINSSTMIIASCR